MVFVKYSSDTVFVYVNGLYQTHFRQIYILLPIFCMCLSMVCIKYISGIAYMCANGLF